MKQEYPIIYLYEHGIIKDFIKPLFKSTSVSEAQFNKTGKHYKDLAMATYANEEELLQALAIKKTFPAFYFHRDDAEWTLMKSYEPKGKTLVDGVYYDTSDEFWYAKITYSGHILCENNLTAFYIATRLRKYLSTHSTVRIPFAFPDEISDNQWMDIQIRYTGIKVTEIANQADTKGSYRDVTLSWYSQIPFCDDDIPGIDGLVERVNLWFADFDEDYSRFTAPETEEDHTKFDGREADVPLIINTDDNND